MRTGFHRFPSHRLLLIGMTAGMRTAAIGCATHSALHSQTAAAASVQVAGVWDGTFRHTLTEGLAAGDTREERQEWHLDQHGRTVSGYYMATLTFTSGDGRPYVCSRQPQFSAVVRVDVSGSLSGHSLSLVELEQRTSDGPCALGQRPLDRMNSIPRKHPRDAFQHAHNARSRSYHAPSFRCNLSAACAMM
jgi:hypothetical protein